MDVFSAEVASAYYSRARDEVIERIKLRDSAMSIFLSSVSAIGTLYGGLVAFLGGTPSIILYGSYLLVLICILANSAAAVVSQHHVLIGALENYLVTELDPVLRSKGISFPQWDSSKSVMEMKTFSIISRSKGHQLLIVRIALTSAIFFILLQIVFGPHFGIVWEYVNNIGDLYSYLMNNKVNFTQVVISVVATVVALKAVFSARSSLKAGAAQRRRYMDQMNEYINNMDKPANAYLPESGATKCSDAAAA